MTLANIKSPTVRRTLIIITVPLLPLIITVISLIEAADEFAAEFKDQWTQGGDGLWNAIKSCWRG